MCTRWQTKEFNGTLYSNCKFLTILLLIIMYTSTVTVHVRLVNNNIGNLVFGAGANGNNIIIKRVCCSYKLAFRKLTHLDMIE